MKPITVTGKGEVIIKAAVDFYEGTYSPDKNLVSIVNVDGIVILENLTIINSKRSGINVFESTNVTLTNITSNDNDAAGVVVNNSVVVANNLNTSGNAWYGVNVDNGSNPSDGAPKTNFTLVSGTIDEDVQIISDKGDVIVVVPNDYLRYEIAGTTKIIWINKEFNMN
jgi:hypothetical protein